ncbi:diaminopimelate epimerase [Corynebacterium sp. HMSC11D10]|uniref:diaminopimelate epimerase n=1 Tax=Corynebacterium sp. HMSC11D10 TaxID=1581088 RepID=UPI0008A2F1E1|nr:diaminopimelate epimerase [Corynebacterium sp. HMSC11D10]OFU56689.1 diaminopimelate epimerase [Corynebacterium sp. HMSC11D10]
MKFLKAHATENDFVVLIDVDDQLGVTPEHVAFLCDRRAGVGGDGLLRVVRRDGMWFMDYRNADGSIAEMCGNGIRAFSHVLVAEGLEDAREFDVDTRAGVKHIRVLEADEANAVVSVGMGAVQVTGVSTASMGDNQFAGIGVDVGNPHLACVIPGLTPEGLAEMNFVAPTFDPEFFPEGVNVEVLTELRDGEAHMRVWERGVGETRSCGTGTVAAAQAVLADAGIENGAVTINVPGGAVKVELNDGVATMTGPATIVFRGELVSTL